jgi:cytochrome c553
MLGDARFHPGRRFGSCFHPATAGKTMMKGHGLHSILALVGMAGAALIIAPGDAAVAADAAAGRQKATVCRACHGVDGVSRMPNAPTIAGESDIYLAKQLEAFRSGERKDPQMSIIAQSLSDDDIANLAAWYSSIEVTVKVPE